MSGSTASSIAQACVRLSALGMASANGGNVSVRASKSRVLVTPTGMCLHEVTPGDLVTVNMSGRKLKGRGKPSIETQSHLAFYEERPDIRSVIHCHPPYALAWALARKAPPMKCFCEGYFLVDDVKLVRPYQTPVTQPAVVRKHAAKVNGFLLSNHGLLMAGAELRTALLRVETYELLCQSALQAERIGGAQQIEPRQLAWLRRLHDEHFPR